MSRRIVSMLVAFQPVARGRTQGESAAERSFVDAAGRTVQLPATFGKVLTAGPAADGAGQSGDSAFTAQRLPSTIEAAAADRPARQPFFLIPEKDKAS